MSYPPGTFESSVNSYDSQTHRASNHRHCSFESSVNSYDSQTCFLKISNTIPFESSVNSYDSQTYGVHLGQGGSLRVV